MNLDIRTLPTIDAGITSWTKHDNVMLISYSPQNGTKYYLIFTNINGADEVGEAGGWLVTWLNAEPIKSMVITDNVSLLHYSYVMEKMRVNVSDAICLAEIIGHCTGREFISCEEISSLEKG